ncbi:hypothetical protein FSP39_015818 [Pinctada imbricata]|uniref:Protein YIPF3 n=1 Tax=Pinctada imbricata TaxID=66713 RepID=A0AA89CAY1_PINIB|nr:hypothetical protein FSP39_015818 [Pinctada imbricata]
MENLKEITLTHCTKQSAVIDLGDVETEEFKVLNESDYESDEVASRKDKGGGGGQSGSPYEAAKQSMTENMTKMMWQAGTQQARKAWSLYGNIDILRPYFDVEPHEVRTRLFQSFIPKPIKDRQKIHKELYGPVMVIFTLIALLLFQMKAAEHKVEEGTLMGTAFGVCFTYWLGAAGLMWFLCFVCNTRISAVQILSLLGYGLSSHCVVILLGTVIHTSHDHIFFYCLWAIIGGLSTLRMVSVVLSRTQGHRQRLILSGVLTTLHLLFLLYLHFAYHQIVEDLSGVFDDKDVVPNPVKDNVHDSLVDNNIMGNSSVIEQDHPDVAHPLLTSSN